MNELSLFSGVGGGLLGTMLRGEPMRYNKFVRKILLRLADVPIPWVRNQILDYLYPDDMVLYFGGE